MRDYLGAKPRRAAEEYIQPRWTEQHAHLAAMRVLLAKPPEPVPHPARPEAKKGYAHRVTAPGPPDRMQVVLPALLMLQCERRIHDAWLASAHGEGGEAGAVSAESAVVKPSVVNRFASRKRKRRSVRRAGYLAWLKLVRRRRKRREVVPISRASVA